MVGGRVFFTQESMVLGKEGFIEKHMEPVVKGGPVAGWKDPDRNDDPPGEFTDQQGNA